MQVGVIGLGRMGGGMALRLIAAGHTVVGYNRTTKRAEEMAASGLVVATTLAELVEKLDAPRAVYVMLPAGEATEEEAQEAVASGGEEQREEGVADAVGEKE